MSAHAMIGGKAATAQIFNQGYPDHNQRLKNYAKVIM
jgi:hypothetical protein